jgi:histone arginine demethylase JMJD6
MFRFNDLHGEEITLNDFCRYAHTPDDDFPLGLYDSQVGVHPEDPRRIMLDEYSTPEFFGKDMFDLVPSTHPARPPFRWLLIGLPRGGTEMHVDPLGTSAWVTLVQGRKRWALFPPDFDDKALGGVHCVEINSKSTTRRAPPSAVEWYLRFWGTPGASEGGMVEILQQAGDTVFIPGGWKHIVINLDETVAITHNYAPAENLDRIRNVVRETEPEFSQVWEDAMARGDKTKQ